MGGSSPASVDLQQKTLKNLENIRNKKLKIIGGICMISTNEKTVVGMPCGNDEDIVVSLFMESQRKTDILESIKHNISTELSRVESIEDLNSVIYNFIKTCSMMQIRLFKGNILQEYNLMKDNIEKKTGVNDIYEK